jgi:hypothetical protein
MSRLEDLAVFRQQMDRAEAMLQQTGAVLARMRPEHFRAAGQSACREVLALQKRVLDLLPEDFEGTPEAILRAQPVLDEALGHLERLLPLLELAGSVRVDTIAGRLPRRRATRRRAPRRRSRASRTSAARAGPVDEPPPRDADARRLARAKRSP